MIHPDEAQRLIARGASAHALVTSSSYLEAMRDLETLHVSAMLACSPGDADRPALVHHHTMLSALKDLAAQLAGYVVVGEELQADLDRLNDPHFEEDSL